MELPIKATFSGNYYQWTLSTPVQNQERCGDLDGTKDEVPVPVTVGEPAELVRQSVKNVPSETW